MAYPTKCNCGGKAVPSYLRDIERARYAWTVVCKKCGRQGTWADSMEKAIKAWDRSMVQPSLFED